MEIRSLVGPLLFFCLSVSSSSPSFSYLVAIPRALSNTNCFLVYKDKDTRRLYRSTSLYDGYFRTFSRDSLVEQH